MDSDLLRDSKFENDVCMSSVFRVPQDRMAKMKPTSGPTSGPTAGTATRRTEKVPSGPDGEDETGSPTSLPTKKRGMGPYGEDETGSPTAG